MEDRNILLIFDLSITETTMKNNRTLINYIKEFIHTETIKDNIKLLIYVSQNNDYDSFDVDDWVEISNEPLTEND